MNEEDIETILSYVEKVPASDNGDVPPYDDRKLYDVDLIAKRIMCIMDNPSYATEHEGVILKARARLKNKCNMYARKLRKKDTISPDELIEIMFLVNLCEIDYYARSGEVIGVEDATFDILLNYVKDSINQGLISVFGGEYIKMNHTGGL